MKVFAALMFFYAAAAGAQTAPVLDPVLGISTIPLYSAMPKASAPDAASEPTLTVFLPQHGRATGSAIVIAPGGAYIGLASNLEGRQVADWFTARGFTAFVLKYRLGAANLYPAPLMDAQRAVRLVRSQAKSYGLSPNRIGIMGFSAGGHLAAMESVSADAPVTGSADPVDQVSSRPDFVVLGYPWLNAMEPAQKSEITYCSMIKVLNPAQCAALREPYTPKLHVTASTPTTFIYSTTDDVVVPVRASTEYYDAMLKAGAPVEMHIFRHGQHGSGLGMADAALDLWPVLLEQWLRDIGLLTKDPAITEAPGK